MSFNFNEYIKTIKSKKADETSERKTNIKKLRSFILIVCEGTKTEPNYFEAIKKTFPPKVLNTYEIDIKGTGTSALKIVEIADKKRAKAARNNRIYDEVWTVFDRDSFPIVDFNNAIFKGIDINIYTAWSNEAFELWYILHFQFRNTGMSRTEYEKIIEKEMNGAFKKAGIRETFKYKKNSPEMYDLLQKYGDESQAIKWAKKLDANFSGDTNYSSHNPCTKVYKLIEKLNEIRKP